MNKDFKKFISSERIHIIPNELTKNMADLFQSAKDDTINDAFLQSRYYALQDFPIAAPQSESHEDSIAVHKHIDWTVDKIAELQSQLPVNPVQSVIEQATERLHSDINEHFKGILKKRGISEEDWRQYGSYRTNERMFEYFYKDECIFVVNGPIHNFPTDSNPTEGSCSYYYWEVENNY